MATVMVHFGLRAVVDVPERLAGPKSGRLGGEAVGAQKARVAGWQALCSCMVHLCHWCSRKNRAPKRHGVGFWPCRARGGGGERPLFENTKSPALV